MTVNEGMWRVFEPELRRRLSELDATATTGERVQAVLLELIPGNAASIDAVAVRLGMSRRTLQRRPEEEGESFRALINRTREKLARHYLQNSALSGSEIAFYSVLKIRTPSIVRFMSGLGRRRTAHAAHLFPGG